MTVSIFLEKAIQITCEYMKESNSNDALKNMEGSLWALDNSSLQFNKEVKLILDEIEIQMYMTDGEMLNSYMLQGLYKIIYITLKKLDEDTNFMTDKK